MSKKRKKSARQLYAEAYRLVRLKSRIPRIEISTEIEAIARWHYWQAVRVFEGWTTGYREAKFKTTRKVRYPNLDVQEGYIPF